MIREFIVAAMAMYTTSTFAVEKTAFPPNERILQCLIERNNVSIINSDYMIVQNRQQTGYQVFTNYCPTGSKACAVDPGYAFGPFSTGIFINADNTRALGRGITRTTMEHQGPVHEEDEPIVGAVLEYIEQKVRESGKCPNIGPLI